jgi:hypothetical protein
MENSRMSNKSLVARVEASEDDSNSAGGSNYSDGDRVGPYAI